MARLLQKLSGGRGALLGALFVVAWALAGCLSPPPIEEEPVTNSAPVVDPDLVVPTEPVVTLSLADDPLLDFSVEGAVTDEDGDRVFFYWFLLYEVDEGNQPPVSPRATYTYLPCRRGRPPLPTEPSIMFLQVDISDRARLKGPDGEELEEPRTYPEDATVQTLTWVLVLRGTCPPRE